MQILGVDNLIIIIVIVLVVIIAFFAIKLLFSQDHKTVAKVLKILCSTLVAILTLLGSLGDVHNKV